MAANGNPQHITYAKVSSIQLDPAKRVLAISDIHGNYTGFNEVLQKAEYHDSDQLLIAGDMVEKGSGSLKVLEKIYRMSKRGPVYATKGNCEVWILEKFRDREQVLDHISHHENSTFREMMERLGMTTENFDHEKMVQEFGYLMEWLNELPDILEDPYLYACHAGMNNPNVAENDRSACLRQDAYEYHKPQLDRPILVGHWPTVNYCEKKPDCSPRYSNGVLSLDGGNNVKSDGQLNLVVINDITTMEFDWVVSEMGWLYVADHTQKESTEYRSIVYCDNAVEVLEETQQKVYVRHISSGYKMWVYKEDVYHTASGTRVWDVTDYHPHIEPGDVLYVYRETEDRYFVKKDGILGWYNKQKEE